MERISLIWNHVQCVDRTSKRQVYRGPVLEIVTILFSFNWIFFFFFFLNVLFKLRFLFVTLMIVYLVPDVIILNWWKSTYSDFKLDVSKMEFDSRLMNSL